MVVIGLIILFYFLCKRFKFDDRLTQLRQIMYNAASTPKQMTSYLDSRINDYEEVENDMSSDELKSYQTQYTTLTRSTLSRQQTMTKSAHSGEGTIPRDQSTLKCHYYPNPSYDQNWSFDLEATTDSYKLRELQSEKTTA